MSLSLSFSGASLFFSSRELGFPEGEHSLLKKVLASVVKKNDMSVPAWASLLGKGLSATSWSVCYSFDNVKGPDFANIADIWLRSTLFISFIVYYEAYLLYAADEASCLPAASPALAYDAPANDGEDDKGRNQEHEESRGEKSLGTIRPQFDGIVSFPAGNRIASSRLSANGKRIHCTCSPVRVGGGRITSHHMPVLNGLFWLSLSLSRMCVREKGLSDLASSSRCHRQPEKKEKNWHLLSRL